MTETSSKWSWIWAGVAVLAIAAAVYLYLNPRTVTVTRTEFKTVPQIQKVAEVQRVYVPVKQVVALDKHEVAKKLDMPWLESGPQGSRGDGGAPGQDGTLIPQPPAMRGDVGPRGEAGPTGPIGLRGPDGLLVAGEPVQAAEPAPVPGDPAALQVTATAELPKTDSGQKLVAVLNTDTGVTTLVSKENPAPWWEWNNALVLGLRYGIDTSLEKTGTVYGSWEFLRVKQFHLIGYGELNTNAEGKIQADIQYRR